MKIVSACTILLGYLYNLDVCKVKWWNAQKWKEFFFFNFVLWHQLMHSFILKLTNRIKIATSFLIVGNKMRIQHTIESEKYNHYRKNVGKVYTNTMTLLIFLVGFANWE